MKIAWFGHVASARRDGVVTYSREMVTGLRARGLDVLFFFHAARERAPRDPHGIRIGHVDFLRRATVSSLRAKDIIQAALARERPEVAHVSVAFSNLDSALPELCHDQNIPIVATMHFPLGPADSSRGSVWRLGYRLWAPSLAKYDAVIVFSERQRKLLADYGVAPERVHIIPNGVNVDLFAPGEASYKEQVGARLLVTYLGRVDFEKNVSTLAEAFRYLDLPADHKLVVVGDGNEYATLRRVYGRDPRILFRGYVSNPAEAARILRASDIFVLPSSTEGLSLSMLEAMASGCAVIATDVGSDAEALSGAGIVLDLEGVGQQLVVSLRTLIDFPDFREDLRRRSRTRAVADYSMQTNLDRVEQLYRTVRAEYDAGGPAAPAHPAPLSLGFMRVDK